MFLTPWNKKQGKYNLYNTDISFRNVVRMKMNINLAHFSAALDPVIPYIYMNRKSSNLFPKHSVLCCNCNPLCFSSFPGLTVHSDVNLCMLLSATQQCTQREMQQNQTQILQSRKHFKNRGAFRLNPQRKRIHKCAFENTWLNTEDNFSPLLCVQTLTWNEYELLTL